MSDDEYRVNNRDKRHGASRTGRTAAVALLYLIAYLAASWCDLYTTRLALQRPGTTEGNVYSINDRGYSSARAWAITGLGALVIESLLVCSLLTSRHISRHWLRHPIRSFNKFYIIPWSKRVRDRSSLHMVSFVIAFVPLRLLAGVNNVVIIYYGTAPVGSLVGIASRHTTPTIGFWLVLGPLFCLLAVAFSPLAALVIKHVDRAVDGE
jgi:hypothetical protein